MKAILKRAFVAFSIIYAAFFSIALSLVLGWSWMAVVAGCAYGVFCVTMIFRDPVRRARIEKLIIDNPLPWDETELRKLGKL